MTAGVSGNAQAVVMAFSMMPFQLLGIGNCPIPTNENTAGWLRSHDRLYQDGEIAFRPVKGRSIFDIY